MQTDDPVESNDSSKCVPDIGCLVNGLYLDGAAWCRTENHLVESKHGILFDEMVTVSTIHTTYKHYTYTNDALVA